MNESRNKWIAVRLLYGLIVAYIIYLTGMVISFAVCDYSTLINWFLNRYPEAYRIDEYHSLYFTLEHHTTVQHISPVLLVVLLAALALLIARRKQIDHILLSLLEDCCALFMNIRNACTHLSRKEILILSASFLLILTIRVYLLFELPYHVDEVFNFIYFTHNGFLHTTLFINNHVLYNLISVTAWKLGADPVL